jgi:peptidyl-tRNA hydrolase, PTH2 family
MTPGKIASQAGHAYLGAFLQTPLELQTQYQSDGGMGTKICLKAKNLIDIFKAENDAKESGIPHFKVIDSGCENFYEGKPIVTALGLGPATKEQINEITKKFKLL